jgi:hypothetical protein
MNASPGMSRAQSGVFWYHLSSTAILQVSPVPAVLLAFPSMAAELRTVSEAAVPLPSAPWVAAVGVAEVVGW